MTTWLQIAQRKIKLYGSGMKPEWTPTVKEDIYKNCLDASEADEAWLMTRRQMKQEKPTHRGYIHQKYVIETLMVRPK